MLQQDPFLLLYEKCGKFHTANSEVKVAILKFYLQMIYTIHALSVTQCKRLMNNQWLADEVHGHQKAPSNCMQLAMYYTDSPVLF